MAVDLTTLYLDLVVSSARAQRISDEDLKKLRSAQLLRSLGSKNAFSKAAEEVAQNIAYLRRYLVENQQQYFQPGGSREPERDKFEEEIGIYVRACSDNINKLQSMLKNISTGSPAKAILASSDVTVHRQGSILILSERLATLTSAFDRLRSIRFKQIQQEEMNRKRRTPQLMQQSGRNRTLNRPASEIQRHFKTAFLDAIEKQSRPPEPSHISEFVQKHVDTENLALQAELLSLSNTVHDTEKTVKEIATLNQMFSTVILQQSEQIEKLYSEAVAATANLVKANVQLDKAVRTNHSSQKCLFLLLLFASIALLFFDWWYS